ncbi:Electron transport complex protein RnfC [Candidatus Arsenophonus lipoptenae]|uniref:Ion-translocating oxidoreductase complex subunit C n=1 Tax=Candidatus Arsenophonus lipoptenae TaxID=634113 RepID=A0A0X9VLS7_9GAMM|nr:electron transport complex subunit RsxC [Candidatus Arsenophonus lipoptenae]AMA64641.1 Electron transport complex protein RnfC [Candidatus Arsenophonus lipoptenae]
MFNIFQKFKFNKKKLFDILNKIYPFKIKKKINLAPLRILPLADEFIIPIQQHVGTSGDIIVKPGDYVLKGQPLTIGCKYKIPVHATTSGTIIEIVEYITEQYSGPKELCIRLKPDNKDKWCELKPLTNYSQYSIKVVLSHIEQAGIVELGNLCFPTAIKLKNNNKVISTLIINAVEYVKNVIANDQLIQEYTDEIIDGILILKYITKPKRILIVIADSNIASILSLKKAIYSYKYYIKLIVIKSKYPVFENKVLIKILTGKKILSGINHSASNIMIQDISTVVAIKQAIIDGKPLIERVVTLIRGDIAKNSINYLIRFGTPINFFLKYINYIPQSNQMIIIGGPLIGFTLSNFNIPFVKLNNYITVINSTKIEQHSIEYPCIKCDRCTQVCPVNLSPQQLYRFIKGQEYEKAQKINLLHCIECGACDYVCPSNITLVKYYRQAKFKIQIFNKEKQSAADAKNRFEAKNLRIEQNKILQQKYKQQIEITLKNDEKIETTISTNKIKNTIKQKSLELRKAIIADAVARVKEKRNKLDIYNK